MINLVLRRLNQPAALLLAGSAKKTNSQLSKLFLLQSNNICHKNDIDPYCIEMRYPPFPYKEKPLTYFHRYFKLEGFNPTLGKFTENTKVVVIEGNIGSGKEELGKKLADDLGIKYWGDISADMDYKREDGFDYRDLNIQLHEDVWYPDFKSVLQTRNPYQAAAWELYVLRLRCYHYLAGLTHMMNTGDGIILERSPWTGTVFARTLKDLNLVGSEFLEHYWEMRSAAFSLMYRPHVIIYLDVPIDKCLENARKKNSHGTGDLLDEQYLETVEKNYKKHFLPIIGEHAEVFTYKLNQPVTAETASELSELVVDELSQSDMDEYYMNVAQKNDKFEDWRLFDSDERLNSLRFEVTKEKSKVLEKFEFAPYYVDELWPAHNLLFARNFVQENAEEKINKEQLKNASLMEKMFGKRRTFDQKDTENWLIRTGFPPDYFQMSQ